MQGTYEVTIENKKIRYMFTIRRNLTIIRGDSATGKTTLIDMVREYAENGANSGITLSCICPCVVLEGVNWRSVLPNYQNSIVFIDEGNTFITSKEFASVIAQTNNYYVIATRDALPMLPYSVEEIYGIRTSNKYGSLKKVHNELYILQRKNPRLYFKVGPWAFIFREIYLHFSSFKLSLQLYLAFSQYFSALLIRSPQDAC